MSLARSERAAPPPKGMAGLKVVDVERIWLDVPFRDRCAPWNEIVIGQWRLIEVIRVVTNDPELVGYGESILDYTPAAVSDAGIQRVRGRNPADLMAEDSLGLGLQMALYDVVGKALGVSVGRLFGQPHVRDECPLGWWNTKMPPLVLADEARDAVGEGYRWHKFKARPWFDVYDQVSAISDATPDDYTLDADWNEMLLDAASATPVLLELEKMGRIGLFETPIRHGDHAGYQLLHSRVTHPLVDHYLDLPYAAGRGDEAVDGYVVAWMGIAGTLAAGAIAAQANHRFFLQMCGTGITTACALHLGSVLSHAQWPHITAMNTFSDDLIESPIQITGGYAAVPDGPGLGVEIDEAALSRFSVPRPDPIRYPRMVLTIEWQNGRRRSYSSGLQMWADCLAGNVPVQERGACLSVSRDDGTVDFDALFARCEQTPLSHSRAL